MSSPETISESSKRKVTTVLHIDVATFTNTWHSHVEIPSLWPRVPKNPWSLCSKQKNPAWSTTCNGGTWIQQTRGLGRVDNSNKCCCCCCCFCLGALGQFFCDLFGMIKWAIERLSDLWLGDKMVTMNSPGAWILWVTNVRIFDALENAFLPRHAMQGGCHKMPRFTRSDLRGSVTNGEK